MAAEVYAPMQGSEVDILLEPGDEVEEDEPILLIEALKMKIPVVSPADGVLQEYAVEVGQEIEGDTLLAVIDET